MKPRRDRRRGEEGTSALELMMTISIIFFLMLAVIQVSLISVTKLITNYAAWSAARSMPRSIRGRRASMAATAPAIVSS